MRLGVLACLVLLPLGLAACGSGAQDDDLGGAESAAEASSTPTEETSADAGAAGAVLLTAPDDVGSGRCMAPSADVLGKADVAFDGTVLSVEHGLVDLEVSRWYRGAGDADGGLATVRAQSGAMQALIGAVAFEEGGRFLVAGIDGELMVCGLSAPYDEALAGLYEEAFDG